MIVERAYHDLMWLARTWGVNLADIAYLAENDLLQLSVRVTSKPCAVVWITRVTDRQSSRRNFFRFCGLYFGARKR